MSDTLLKVRNTGKEPVTLRHTRHGNVTIDPGQEQIVPVAVVHVNLGSGAVRNEGPNAKFRDELYRKLQVKWGFYAGMRGEDEWAAYAPTVEVFTLDDERVYTILDDPEGTKGSPAPAPSPEANMAARIAELEAQLSTLVDMQNRQVGNEASTPSKPSAATKKRRSTSTAKTKRSNAADTEGEIPQASDDDPDVTTDDPRATRVGS